MKRTLAEAARAIDAQLTGEDRLFGEVSSDTRTLEAGQLFVALRGPNFDANQFVAEAAKRGAAGAIVERLQAVVLPQLVVPDALMALTALARAWRKQFSLPLVGIGGSNGKTTVKEMTAAILSQMGQCLATRGNLNNHIGVPLTLMRLEAAHRSAVIEIGANRAGEVAALAALAEPTVGLVTNAGDEHLEGFGSLEGVARAEGEMFSALGGAQTAVINLDDPFAPLWRELTGARRAVTFGLNAHANCNASMRYAVRWNSHCRHRPARRASACRCSAGTTSSMRSPQRRPRARPARTWSTASRDSSRCVRYAAVST